jgi:hypothetical protein
MVDIKRLTIRLPDGLFQEICRDQDRSGNSISAIVREVLKKHYYGEYEK